MVGSGYKTAAALAYLSAGLHLAALIWAGFGVNGVTMVVGIVLWTATGIGLVRGLRWVAHFGFLLALVGTIVSASMLFDPAWLVPQWLPLALVGADAAVAVTLFGVLWRAPGTAP